MTDTMSTTAAGSLDMSLAKDNRLIVDMSPTVALLHHNAALASHAQALRNLKMDHSCEEQQQQQHHNLSVMDGGSEKNRTPTPTISTNISMSPTNLSTAGIMSGNTAATTFRCERCENFETTSRASLLLHVVQCLANSTRLKAEEIEPENLQTLSSGQLSKSNNGSVVDIRQSMAIAAPASSVVTAIATGSASSPAATSSSGSSTTSSRKVFECDVCNMKFSNGANMRRHKMRHTGVKPYECRVCQKRFFRKDHLAEHFTTHTKTLPYHCPICNRGFQRQIAMRAHFQNEHVGQHDLVKTCPLCSYRANSMKSLRIHVFSKHGIDLDNPGPAGSSTLLLALESQASQVAAAAAAVGFVPASLNAVAAAAAAAANVAAGTNAVNTVAAIASAVNNASSHQSDSGESMRSIENATPPMHFLTPHVEISTMAESGLSSDNALFNGHNHHQQNHNHTGSGGSIGNNHSNNGLDGNNGTIMDLNKERDTIMQSPVPLTMTPVAPPQEHPLDCNAKSLPSSTSNNNNSSSSLNGTICRAMHSVSPKIHQHHHHPQHHHDNHITPSISLIPIKQEPPNDDINSEMVRSLIKSSTCGMVEPMNAGDSSESEFSSPTSRLTSLIKVSPLKSLLREDLKRRICAKASNRITRNANALENNNIIQSTLTPTNGVAVSISSSTPICNGTITSSGQDGDTGSLNRKQILTCLFCGIEFPDETLYFLHKGCHCDSNPWKCNICGEQCNNVYEFNSHLLSKSHQ